MKLLPLFAIALTVAALTCCNTPYTSTEVGYYKPALPFESGAKLGAFTEVKPESIPLLNSAPEGDK